MATVVVGFMYMQSTTVEGTCTVQIKPKGNILPEPIFISC